MIFFWIVVIIVVVWWLASRAKKTPPPSVSNTQEESLAKEIISEESTFNIQTKFENKLHDEIDFPNAIRGKEIYIYQHLMRPWYQKLASENRYNDEMTQKLRNDWLDYMGAVEDRSTCNYLSLEFWDEKEPKKSNDYRDQHVLASRKMFAIEDAFAAAVGKEAVEELNHVHKMDWDQFDKFGNRAPDGFRYDLREKLVPQEKK
jgi:hypothetical protein